MMKTKITLNIHFIRLERNLACKISRSLFLNRIATSFGANNNSNNTNTGAENSKEASCAAFHFPSRRCSVFIFIFIFIFSSIFSFSLVALSLPVVLTSLATGLKCGSLRGEWRNVNRNVEFAEHSRNVTSAPRSAAMLFVPHLHHHHTFACISVSIP